MSKARDIADGKTSGGGGSKNLIINGDMRISQRSTSVTAQTGTAYHCCDRFLSEANGPTYDVEQSTDAPNGFSYSMKVTMDGAFSPSASQYMIPFEYRMEGDDMQSLAYGTSDAKTITLSFWIKSNKTGTYVVDLVNNNSSQQRGHSQSYTVDASDTWEYKTLVYTGDTSTGFDTGNGMEFQLFWWMIAGSTYTSGTLATSWEGQTAANRAVGIPSSSADNDYWQITGVQLEIGSESTDFEHIPYSDQLARCQRYYQKTNSPYSTWGNLSAYATWGVEFATEMRTAPTVTSYISGGNLYSGPFISSTGVDLFLSGQGGGNAYRWGYNCDAEL